MLEQEKKIQILGVYLADIGSDEAINRILGYSEDDGQHYVVTPNPELVVEATKTPDYMAALNGADLSLADGFGLVLAGLLNGKRIQRVPGSDATLKLLPLFIKSKKKVLLINWEKGLSTAEELEREIKTKFPGLDFKTVDIPKVREIPTDKLAEINKFSPDVIFLALGAPWQEYIASSQLSLMSSVKVAICVGGSFEFILGKMKRAPKVFRSIGLEWLWRLIMQPKRFKRIWNAVVVFMFYVILDRMGLYKSNNTRSPK